MTGRLGSSCVVVVVEVVASFVTCLSSSPSPEKCELPPLRVRTGGFISEVSTRATITTNRKSKAMAPTAVDSKRISDITEDGSMDRRGNPAVKAKTGNWRSSILLLVNYGLVTCAFFGVGVNLVVFLRRVLHQDNAEAANSISKWTGTVYIFSLIGAFMSDSYWGRYITCAIFQMIYVTGLVILSLASWFLLVKPTGCGAAGEHCDAPSSAGVALFYLSTYMIAFGNGGYQPSIATFGSDQFDETDPREARSKVAFFSYFYLALNVGSLFSNTVLVYYEDEGRWVMGFWVSAAAAAMALVLFLLGTPNYRHFKPTGNPLTRIAQVFVAAFRKWRAEVPRSELLHEVDGDESQIAGIRKILHSDQIRLCTVTQVEEVKCILKMLPIWLCTIVYSVVFTQMASLFVEQGTTMNTNIGAFHVPAASMSVFDILSVLAFIAIYRRVLVPVMSRLSGNPQGLTELQRMGVGLVVGMAAMVVAGVVEVERLKRVGAPDQPSFGSSLCMASISLGNYVSIMLVSVVTSLTAGDRRPGWIPGNLNSGHLDRFYFLLAALSLVDLAVYVACAVWYKGIKLDSNEEKANKITVHV
uniref:Major facilitator superfamily (MFS) profile domain-containing protein n=1 Tax=Oryza barthii TaxID=65489 RepID=A0A0D3F9P9_9ORYZ